MRFAYIDSQGNEVAIPSVDALALRIELGAIGPDTELYDAQADRWGPARTHEIFHTLSRESEEDGFVAPPPPVTPSAPEAEGAEEAPDEPDAPAPAEDDAAVEPADLAPETPDEEQGGPGVPAGGEERPRPTRFDLSDEFPPGEGPAAAGTAPEEPASDAGGGEMGFDFALTDEDAPPAPEAPAEDPGDMDFGAMAGGMSFDLADEDPAPAAGGADGGESPAEGSGEEEAEEEAAFDFGGVELEMEEPEAEEDEDAGDGSMDLGGGMQLEEPLSEQDSFAGGGGGGGGSGGLDLEQPMSEFSADSPPAWMEQDGPSGGDEEDDGAMDFTPGGVEEAEEEEPPRRRPPAREGAEDGDGQEERERREPRSRPSPPRRTSQRSFAGPLIGLLVVAALGAGGWFGWQAFQGRSAEPEAPVLPPVTIPDIPAELLPTMRDLGEEALAGTVAEMEAMAAEADLPAEPRQEWLSGVYLANASQFGDIQEYWLGIESFVARIQDVDREIFHQEYEEALAAAGIAGDTAAILLERADSGFLATREERFEAYAQMGDLVNAALNLHEFLLANEAAIEYDPAAGGMSADPVLEAVPSSRELGDEMWDRVDRITAALDRLGTLDRVTSERLLAVLFDRIRRAGFE